MNDVQFNELIENVGSAADDKIPLNSSFMIVAYNPATHCTHVWVPHRVNPDQVVPFSARRDQGG